MSTSARVTFKPTKLAPGVTPDRTWPEGMIEGESSEDYHACEALSSTKLEDFRYRERYYYEKHVAKTLHEKKSQSLEDGAAFHCVTLEGIESFKQQYVIVPADAPRRPTAQQLNAKKPSEETIATIKWWDEFKAANVGKHIIEAADYYMLIRYADAIMENPMAADLLTAPGVKTELTFRTAKTAFGFRVQCKADVYNPIGCPASNDLPYVLDVKTVECIDTFPKHFFDFGYYRRGPFYSQVISTVAGMDSRVVVPKRFFYVAVEKSQPHACTVFEPDGLSVDEGSKENIITMQRLANCYTTNEWSRGAVYANVGLPNFKVAQIQREANS